MDYELKCWIMERIQEEKIRYGDDKLSFHVDKQCAFLEVLNFMEEREIKLPETIKLSGKKHYYHCHNGKERESWND